MESIDGGAKPSPLLLIKIAGNVIVNKDGTKSSLDQVGSTVIMLYFSASWCRPCRKFTPLLKTRYEELKEEGRDFEIIFISWDRNEKECNDYWGTQPWKLLGFKEKNLRAKLSAALDIKKRGVPTLVVFDGKKLICDDGKSAILTVDFDRLAFFAEDKAKAAKEEKYLFEQLCLEKENRLAFIEGANIISHKTEHSCGIATTVESLKGTSVIGLFFR